jgi:hypothetical protein
MTLVDYQVLASFRLAGARAAPQIFGNYFQGSPTGSSSHDDRLQHHYNYPHNYGGPTANNNNEPYGNGNDETNGYGYGNGG